MPPLEFQSSEPLDKAANANLGGGSDSIAREVQNQFSGMASVGKDAAMASMPGAMPMDAGIGALPGAGEQAVSPLINMITKMPGHIGLLSNFFEMLGAFFGPQMEALSQFGMSLGLDHSFLGGLGGDHIASALSHGAEHIGLNLSLLPGNAPILGHLGSGLQNQLSGSFNSDLLSSKLNTSLGQSSDIFSRESFSRSLNVSGSGNMAKSAFEGVGQGHLSGPGVSQGIPDAQVAGNNRLFSDSVGGGHSLNSQSMAQSVSIQTPVQPSASSLNVSGSTFGEPISGISGNNDLLAMGNTNDSFQSTVGNMKADVPSHGGAEDLGGLKAKPLSLDGHKVDLKADSLGDKAVSNHDLAHKPEVKPEAKNELAKVDHKVDAKDVRTHKTFDRASHSIKQSHQNIAQNKPPVSAPKQPVQTGHGPKADLKADLKADPKAPEAQANVDAQKQFEQQELQQQQQVAQDSPKAEGTDAQSAAIEPRSYTIRSGDNLWNIAKDNLGDATKWSDIYKMNSDVLGANPELIRPGTTIQLPGVDAAAATNVAHYTVQPGDNLWDIAHEQLGDATKWGDIYKANSEVIGSNPGMIHPGQELTLTTADPASMQLSSATGAGAPSVDPGHTLASTGGAANLHAAPGNDMAQAESQAQVAQTPTDSYGAEPGATEQAIELQPEAPHAASAGGSASFGRPEGAGTASSFSNYDAMKVQHQLPNPASLGEKVIPAAAQPDAIIQPAHAATTNMFASKPAVNTNLGNDMLNFLKKRR